MIVLTRSILFFLNESNIREDHIAAVFFGPIMTISTARNSSYGAVIKLDAVKTCYGHKGFIQTLAESSCDLWPHVHRGNSEPVWHRDAQLLLNGCITIISVLLMPSLSRSILRSNRYLNDSDKKKAGTVVRLKIILYPSLSTA